MTRLLHDILGQPAALLGALDHYAGAGREPLGRAARLLRGASHVYLTGMGSSMHAALAVQAMLLARGRPSCWVDSSELLLSGPALPPNSVLFTFSRSGKSIEVVKAAGRARSLRCPVLAVTNDASSPLAELSECILEMRVPADHAVSVATYVGCSFAGGLLVKLAYDRITDGFLADLRRSLEAAAARLPDWQRRVEEIGWPLSEHPPYFLGRGVSASSAWEAQMIWEEAAKSPASAMTTGEFRHGPQEIFHTPGIPVGLFVHATAHRDTDLAIAREMNGLGANPLVIGQRLPADLPFPGFDLPEINPDFQFAMEGIPIQLCAERLSRRKGVDCDSFRYGSFVVESEEGIARSAPR